MRTHPPHPPSRSGPLLWPRPLAALGLMLVLIPGIPGAVPGPTGPVGAPEARGFMDHGRDYARHGQWQAAIALYKNALDINPALADAHFLLGVAYYQQEKAEEAIAALRRAGKLDPRSARNFYNLGVAYAHTGETDKEIAAYKHTIRLDPDHISAHYNLATAYWAQGRDGMACGKLFRAARLYHEADQPRQAREMLNLIRRISPDSAYREALAKLLKS